MSRRESRRAERDRPFPARRVVFLGVKPECAVGTSSISAGQMLTEADMGWDGLGEGMQDAEPEDLGRVPAPAATGNCILILPQ